MIYVFDTPSSPLRLIAGAGIGFTQGGDYISIAYTGTIFTGTASGALSGLTQNRIPYVYTGSALIDSANLTFDGLDLTHYSGTATLNILNVSGLLTANGGINIPDGQNLDIGNGEINTFSTDINIFGGSWSSTGMNMNISGNVDISGRLDITGDDIHILGGSYYVDTQGAGIGFDPGAFGLTFYNNRTQVNGPQMYVNLATGTVAFFGADYQLTGSTNLLYDETNLTLTNGNFRLDTNGKAITMRRTTSNSEIEVMKIITGTDTFSIKMPTSVGAAIGLEIRNTSEETVMQMTREGQIRLAMTGSTGGIRLGGDVDLYRSSANVLASPDLISTIGGAAGFQFQDRNNSAQNWTLYGDRNFARLYKDFDGAGDVFIFTDSGYVSGTKYYNGSYTPTWTATTSGTSVGNGTLVGRYQRFGNICHTFVQLDIGSSTNKGFGVWEFTLPITPFTGTARFPIGSAFALDNGVADYIGSCRLDISTSKVRVFFQTGSRSSGAGSNFPMIWGTSDTVIFDIKYEV